MEHQTDVAVVGGVIRIIRINDGLPLTYPQFALGGGQTAANDNAKVLIVFHIDLDVQRHQGGKTVGRNGQILGNKDVIAGTVAGAADRQQSVRRCIFYRHKFSHNFSP